MTMQPRWRKVLQDLWGNKVRTGLVVLSIAIGVFAIGMILASNIMLREDFYGGYQETEPADAVLFISPFSDDLLTAARNVPGVAVAEARRGFSVRAQVGPDDWRRLDIEALPDFEDMSLSLVFSEQGAWPPPDNTLLVERDSLGLLGAAPGDVIVIERPDGRLREVTISGLAHDINRIPARFSGQPSAFVTMDTLEWLGFDESYSEMHLRMDGEGLSKKEIEEIAAAVEDKVKKAGYDVYRVRVPEPGVHPLQDIIDPMLLILGVLGALSLFASSFLVINIISGLMSQQTQQIGIMKAVGASRGQIVRMYLVAMLVLGLLALLLAVPLGGLAAYAFTRYIAGLLNFDMSGFRIPLPAVAVMFAVGLLVPFVAALVPVRSGSRITVREALSSYGLGKGHFGTSLFDRLLAWLTGTVLGLSRPMQISLRNTIRRKGRLLLTLITLTLGGSIFIGITSVHASLLNTLDDSLAYFAYDVEVNFDRDYRMEELAAFAADVPGVAHAESWVWTSTRRLRPSGEKGDDFAIVGIPAATDFVRPILLEGRWLTPEDEGAVVLNSDVIDDEIDVALGDVVRLEIGGREVDWPVVGIVQGVMTGPIAYVNRPQMERVLRQTGRASSVLVVGDSHSPDAQQALAARLQTTYRDAGYQVGTVDTIQEVRDRVEFQFNLIVFFLTIMAILIATVGGLGLMGTMSINVLERTREIGVMRAVGASDGSVLRIVLVEGVFVGLISWLFSAIIGYPMGRVLSDLVGNSLLDNPLRFTYAYNGAIAWLIAVLAIAALASLFPAWRASRLSVQQTLAYE